LPCFPLLLEAALLLPADALVLLPLLLAAGLLLPLLLPLVPLLLLLVLGAG
jgi:hypothetical protein